MNAVDQARTPEMAAKIASLTSLFREEFLGAEPDLSPWLMDGKCDDWLDPNSADVSFHLGGMHPTCRSHCVLALVHYDRLPYDSQAEVIEIEAIGFCNEREQWRVSTDGLWSFEGRMLPTEEAQEKLSNFFRGVFHLFRNSMYGPYQFR
ncbi:MAG: hypothetical protein AAGB01_00565 [Cyanobacteria bacterium P01_F01_bin.42]